MRLDVSRSIAAPAERVWEVLVDIPGSPQIISAIDSVEMLAGPDPLDVGTRWRETRTMMGKSATEEMWVTAVDPGRSYSVAADSRGAAYESRFDVTPTGADSCTLALHFEGHPQGTGGKVLAATVGRLFLPMERKALEKDLADIAVAAESRA